MGRRPFSEPAHAFFQIASCLELGIGYRCDGDVGERMAKEGAQVLGEATEGVFTALSTPLTLRVRKVMYALTHLETMDEAQE